MSQRKARAARQAAGFVKVAKQPTPIIDAAYIQNPVSYDPIKREYVYRSGKQVRAYLRKRIGDEATLALESELQEMFAARVATEEEDVDQA